MAFHKDIRMYFFVFKSQINEKMMLISVADLTEVNPCKHCEHGVF